MTLEIDEDGCGQLHLDLPADATDEEISHIKTLVERVGSALLELHEQTPGPGSVDEDQEP